MIILYLVLIIITCIVIWKASDYFEAATDYFGRNMSEGVKGASLNAIASSMPEVLTGFMFLFYLHGSDGYSGTIGTTAGSAVFNSLIIPGAVILMVTLYMGIKNFSISRKVAMRDGLFLLLAEIVLIVIIDSNVITYKEGGLLILLYLVYLGYMFGTMRRKKKVNVDNECSIKKSRALRYLIFSVIFMTLACWLLVFCVEKIGQEMNIHLMFVSIVLASAASSVPDTIISLKDAKKGNYDDAVSNALGSNIFDICIAHGLPLFIYTLIYEPVVMTSQTTENSVELRIWLFILTAITVILYLTSKKINKFTGILMLLLYSLFVLFVIGKAFGSSWAIEFGQLINFY